MQVSKGLYEVITSERLTPAQKQEAIRHFAQPVDHAGFIEPPELTEEDAELLCTALDPQNSINPKE